MQSNFDSGVVAGASAADIHASNSGDRINGQNPPAAAGNGQGRADGTLSPAGQGRGRRGRVGRKSTGGDSRGRGSRGSSREADTDGRGRGRARGRGAARGGARGRARGGARGVDTGEGAEADGVTAAGAGARGARGGARGGRGRGRGAVVPAPILRAENFSITVTDEMREAAREAVRARGWGRLPGMESEQERALGGTTPELRYLLDMTVGSEMVNHMPATWVKFLTSLPLVDADAYLRSLPPLLPHSAAPQGVAAALADPERRAFLEVHIHPRHGIQYVGVAQDPGGSAAHRVLTHMRIMKVLFLLPLHPHKRKAMRWCQRVCQHGIVVGLRRFKYLAHKTDRAPKTAHFHPKAFFLALDSAASWDLQQPHIFHPFASAWDARAVFGNFDSCPNVPKLAARIGLIFSRTYPMLDASTISPAVLQIADDETCEDGTNSTDGNGMILAALVPPKHISRGEELWADQKQLGSNQAQQQQVLGQTQQRSQVNLQQQQQQRAQEQARAAAVRAAAAQELEDPEWEDETRAAAAAVRAAAALELEEPGSDDEVQAAAASGTAAAGAVAGQGGAAAAATAGAGGGTAEAAAAAVVAAAALELEEPDEEEEEEDGVEWDEDEVDWDAMNVAVTQFEQERGLLGGGAAAAGDATMGGAEAGAEGGVYQGIGGSGGGEESDGLLWDSASLGAGEAGYEGVRPAVWQMRGFLGGMVVKGTLLVVQQMPSYVRPGVCILLRSSMVKVAPPLPDPASNLAALSTPILPPSRHSHQSRQLHQTHQSQLQQPGSQPQVQQQPSQPPCQPSGPLFSIEVNETT
ncbi:unnamed protein product [Closterium sp. NIES-64]|nr:unnamed protein product [Closterium sp. NIES-64]